MTKVTFKNIFFTLSLFIIVGCTTYPKEEYKFLFYKQIPSQNLKGKTLLVWRDALDNKVENNVNILTLDGKHLPDNGKIPLPGLRRDAVVLNPGLHALEAKYEPANTSDKELQRLEDSKTIFFSFEQELKAEMVYRLSTSREGDRIIYQLSESPATPESLKIVEPKEKPKKKRRRNPMGL